MRSEDDFEVASRERANSELRNNWFVGLRLNGFVNLRCYVGDRANEAQVGPGTLYRRYKNKSELCLDLIKDKVDLLFNDIENYLEHNHSDPPSQRLKGIIGLFIRFREKKAQLLTGVEDSSSTNPLKARIQSPLFSELHQLLVEMFDEMNAAEQTHFNSVFRADMLLMALSRDFYSLQREVRGYTPEMISEQLCALFISLP